MMDQDTINFEAMKLAIGLAKDLSVQLLTLSSALIGLTVVLSKDIMRTHTTREMLLVFAVLGAFLFSIAFGLYALMRLTGSLAPVGIPAKLTLDAARGGATWQIIAFGVATLLFTLYSCIAIFTFWRDRNQPQPEPEVEPEPRPPVT
jgi:hypothetical protein